MPSLARSVPKPLKVPSLARSVPKPLKVLSLARSVPKPLVVDFFLRFFRFSLRCGSPSICSRCFPALRGPRREPTCIHGWDGMGWDGWMDGMGGVDKYLFFFCLVHKNYVIYDANCFHAPT